PHQHGKHSGPQQRHRASGPAVPQRGLGVPASAPREHSRRRNGPAVMRPQRALAAGALIVLAAGAVVVISSSRRHSTPDATGTNPTLTTARIERTDLVATEQLNGTLGYPPGPRVMNVLDGVYTWLPDEGA